MRVFWIAPLAALAVAGCDQAPTPAVEPTQAPERVKPSAAPVPDTSEAAKIPAASGIPSAIQGRWGLAPADCTSTRGDAKGLLEIDATNLRFYESRGTLGEIASRNDSQIAARFAFTGEGMIWSRDMTLSIENGGKSLVRRESGEDAVPEPLTYTRCA